MDTAFYTLLEMFSEDTKLNDKQYLETVKKMDYDEFYKLIAVLIPTLQETLCRSFDGHYDVLTFNYMENVENECLFFENNDKENYPIRISETKTDIGSDWMFEAIAPHSLYHCLSKDAMYDGIVNLPLVFERHHLEIDDTDYHQTVFVLDCRKKVAFLYDPNGKYSIFSNTDNVHSMLKMYTSLINDECGFSFEYKTLNNSNINLKLPSVGGCNCVVCSILFIMAYSVLGIDIERFDSVMYGSEDMLLKLHLMMYNAIGFTLDLQLHL